MYRLEHRQPSLTMLRRQPTAGAFFVRAAPISAACKAYHRLRGFPEVSDLRIEGALEGGPRRAAVDIGGEALVAGDDVGVLEDAQHCRHHEIASREAIAVKIGLVAERFG